MIRLVIVCLLLSLPAQGRELTVLTAGAFKSVAAALVPVFESSTGDKVTLRNDTVGALVQRISNGEAFDVVLMSPSGLEDLARAGKIVAGSMVKLARVGVGVGVKSGSPLPDIHTAAAFRSAMLQARAVAYVDPASGGSSGIYLAELFHSLGIADAMAPKSVLVKGGLAAEALLDGRADVAVQQISEIIAVPGVTLVGPCRRRSRTKRSMPGQSPRLRRRGRLHGHFLPIWRVLPPNPCSSRRGCRHLDQAGITCSRTMQVA